MSVSGKEWEPSEDCVWLRDSLDDIFTPSPKTNTQAAQNKNQHNGGAGGGPEPADQRAGGLPAADAAAEAGTMPRVFV